MNTPEPTTQTEALAGTWLNHDDPRDEWPGAEDWNLPYVAAILADAEDEFWTAYHRTCTEHGEDAGDAIGNQYEAMARRIFTGPELAAHDATVAAEAKATERERIALAIEAKRDEVCAGCDSCDGAVAVGLAHAARVARTAP